VYRRWLWRLLILVFIPLILLGSLELGLRLAGYGFPTGYFKRFTIEGEARLVDNDQFGLRFFPPALARIPAPVVMGATKAPGTFRVFIFGESAAEGDPRPQFAAGRYLEVLLRERFPREHFEFVNTAVTAINSHVILPIAQDCAAQQGDLWIIYMGNNEMIGPFGAATAFGRRAPPLAFVRLGLLLQRARLGQALLRWTRQLNQTSRSPASWLGMEMFLENKIPPEDPRKQVVYDNFRKNLDDILRAGSRSGAKVLLSTVAVNLKDCPPFASVTETNGTAADRALAKESLSQASAAAERGGWEEALPNYQRAAQLLPHSAEVQFGLGNCLLHGTNSAAAREHFQAAVDEDALIFRADSHINQAIREAGHKFADSAVTLCDSEAELSSLSPGGIPGRDLFYEHVHFNPEGNYRLAVVWADKVASMFPRFSSSPTERGWSSQAACDRLLGLTDWNRLSAVEEVTHRLELPPFNSQAGQARRRSAFQIEADELRHRMATTPLAEVRAVYTEALQRAPRDYQVHENFAEFLEVIGDLQQAAAERQLVCRLIPHYYFPYYSLGRVLKEQGKLAEAQSSLQTALALNPGQARIHRELGVVLARRSRWKEAWTELEVARELAPPDPQLLLFAAEILWKLERRADAMASLREAVRMQPDYWEAHYRLGEDLAMEGQIPEAVAEFKRTVRLKPDYTRAHVNLAVALLRMGLNDEARQEFEETLRLDPRNLQALDFLARYHGDRPRQK